MKHFTKFSEFLKESYNGNVNEVLSPKTDCHEIMTACLCTLPIEKLDSIISKVEKDQKNIPDILAKLSKIANGNKILGASEDDKGSIMTFQYKELALLQALSAAKIILERNSNMKITSVILTGKSWIDKVSKYSGIKNLLDNFGVNSYGMKDFNSSDIILVSEKGGKIDFVGVSLKKKKVGEKDPTIINRSLLDSLPTKARDILEDAFDDFYNKLLSDNCKNLIGDNNVLSVLMEEKKKKTILSAKYPDYLTREDFKSEQSLKNALIKKCRTATRNPNKKIWKILLSKAVGLMVTHNNRVHIRSIINPQLLGKNSPFRQVEKTLTEEGVSAEIALALMEIIFKGQLYALLEGNFKFALCTGTGKLGKKIGAVVGPGEYEPIENITTEMERLRTSGQPTLELTSRKDLLGESEMNLESGIVLSEDDEDDASDDNTEITIFLKLKIGSEDIAIVSVRYKGEYTKGPEILARIFPSFKSRLMDPILSDNENSEYSSTEED